MEDEDDDFLQENPEEKHLDLVVPFKKSVKQIVREVTFFSFKNCKNFYFWALQSYI